MRIATLQFAPKLGDVEGNIRRANELLQNGHPSRGATPATGLDTLKPDILVLPELALTGYNFPSREAIAPYLEPAGQGPSATWARETAKKHRCKVCVGYPEIEAASTERDQASSPGTCYNSLLVVDERGEVILNYRKTFLYYTDETWAAEGDAARSFHTLTLGPPSSPSSKAVATSFGICMDINPYRFEAPFTAWEFAHRVLDSKTQLVVLSMAWLTLLSREELDRLADRPDMDTFNYWIQRFLPLVRKRMQHSVDVDGEGDEAGKQIIIVFANRAGEEAGEDGASPARYAGTSTILAIRQRPAPQSRAAGAVSDGEGGEDGSASDGPDASAFDVKILCWEMMGAGSEGICFADTTADPRMVFGLVKAGT
ncbi:carbon-nitrogen hydrolase [Aspergillus floccosus]